MQRSAAVQRIQAGLGFRDDLQSQIVLRLQEAQRNFEQGNTLPWFLVEEDNQLTLAAGTQAVSLPTGFVRECDWFGPMRYYDATVSPAKPRKIPKKTFDAALAAYGDSEASGPKVYVLRKDSFYFFPVANQEYTLLHSYYKAADPLQDDNDENVWLLHSPELLIGDAGRRIAMDLRDSNAVSIFTDMRDSAWRSVFNETIMREESARRQAVGGGL